MAALRVGMLFDGAAEQYGLLTATAHLVEGFDPARIELTGLFLARGAAEETVAPLCARVERLDVGSIHPLFPPGWRKVNPRHAAGRAALLRRAAQAVGEAARRGGLQVLHTHHPATAWIAWRATRRLPVGRVSHLHQNYPYRGIASAAYCAFARRAMDRIIAISRFVADSVPATLRDRIRMVHNGVPVERLRREGLPGAFRSRYQVPANEPLVGIFGAVVPRKGHVYFVEAAARIAERVPQARFAVVGGAIGGYVHLGAEEELRGHIRRCGLENRMILTGYLPDAVRYMPDFDIIAMPSIDYGAPIAAMHGAELGPTGSRRLLPGEPFGMVVLEAMAHGAAVIATNCGGPPEIVEHDVSGLLVPPKDSAGLAAAMLSLLTDETRRRRIAAAGAARVRDCFDASLTAARSAAVYEE